MNNNENIASQAGQLRIGEKTVNRLGLGTNRITNTKESQDLLIKAVSLGVNFIDTANVYRNGESEDTIGQTLSPYPADLLIATKGGMNGGSPAQLRADLEGSLRRLKTDCIDLYQLHRIDPSVPLKHSLCALKELQEEGKIKHVGLSEVTVSQIEEAQSIVPVVSVQNEYNLVKRQYEDVLDYCSAQGIVFIPWFPLGGLRGDAETVSKKAAQVSEKYKASAQQIALAWLLARSPFILPIPGTLSIEHLISDLESGSVRLNKEDYEQLANI